MYLESPQHQAKGERGQREDKRKLDHVVAFLGADRNLLSLSESDVRRYTMEQVHPLLALALVVAEGTGRRISAWRNLRWDDIDFQTGEIRWQAEFDKSGFEDVRPMSDAVRGALREARKVQRAIGSAPVFPAPKDPTKPCDRDLLDHWLRRAFTKAKLVTERGGLWHTLRRKWAAERKGYPVKDVAAAGGWRDQRTILTSYQQVDAATVKQVVLSPTQRLLGS